VSAGGADDAAVIFDLDGVIVDSEGLQYASYQQVLGRFGVEISRDEYAREWIAKGGGPAYAVLTYNLPVSPDEIKQEKEPVYHRMLREHVTLMPGAAAAIARLGARFPLAVATNSNRADTQFVLEHFGLGAQFSAVVTREKYERAKPEGDAFLAAAEELRMSPGFCVVLEDAFKGVLAAHRAGCPCVAVPNDFTSGNDFALAARVVENLDAVTSALIEELVASVP